MYESPVSTRDPAGADDGAGLQHAGCRRFAQCDAGERRHVVPASEPLDRYLPQFADVKVYKGVDAAGKPILAAPSRKPTIQDAFRHTLGLASGLGQSPVDALYREAELAMGSGRSSVPSRCATRCSAFPRG